MQTYKNNIHIDKEATHGIINGINKIADAVALTMGAKGSNAIIEEDLYPGYIITNDGYSILEKTQFQDPLEELGRKILFDSVSRANKQSGDGSTTTTVLTQAILNEGLKLNAPGVEIRESLNELLPFIEEQIDAQKKIITENELAPIATISAESEEIGNLLQNIYMEIGKDGIVELDNSKTFETHFEIKEGVRFSCGILSPYLFNKPTCAELEKPSILIIKKKIVSVNDIIPIIEKLAQTGKKEIVLFCDEIQDGVTTTLVANHMKGIFSTYIIKPPIVWKDLIFEDFAKVTGATIVSEKSGVDFKDIELSHLGTCDKIVVNKDETTILGTKDVSDHIKELVESGTDNDLRRVAWLTTKAAILKLGANSESELSYKRLKVEDAINASRLALQDGVVAGGGVCLLNVSRVMPDTLGGSILRNALEAPIEQIIKNAGAMKDVIFSDFSKEDAIRMSESLKAGEAIKVNNIHSIKSIPATLENLGEAIGYNAKTREIVNMWDAQILDPALVVKNAIRNAISVAGTALTIKVAIPKDRTEEEIIKKAMMQQQQW